MEDVFIFTEAYNCGKILRKCLETFYEFHNGVKINVFGNPEDFKEVGEFEYVNFVDLSSDENLKVLYQAGHQGTAYIFAKVLNGDFGTYSKVIHMDSDLVFKKECLSDIINKFEEGYDLIGPRRAYKNNVANNDGRFDNLSDVVSTYFFGINLKKMNNYDLPTLNKMCAGYYNPYKHQVIDFFDPVSFDIINNEGEVYYLDFKEYGSCDEEGKFNNGFEKLNELLDCGSKLIHYAGIGSGMNFFHKGNNTVPASYAEWAKNRYAIYMKLYYNEDIDYEYDKNMYEEIRRNL